MAARGFAGARQMERKPGVGPVDLRRLDDAFRFGRDRSDDERDRCLWDGGSDRADAGMNRAMVRAVLYVVGGLLAAGGLALALLGCFPAAAGLAGWGLILIIGLLIERWRYKPLAERRPGPDWTATDADANPNNPGVDPFVQTVNKAPTRTTILGKASGASFSLVRYGCTLPCGPVGVSSAKTHVSCPAPAGREGLRAPPSSCSSLGGGGDRRP